METDLKTLYIHSDPNAPVVLIFGGNAVMRDRVIRRLEAFGKVSAVGVLSEAEGLQELARLPRVDLVLIGGKYTAAQRTAIKAHLRAQAPGTLTSEPGIDYPYGDEGILSDLRQQLQLGE